MRYQATYMCLKQGHVCFNFHMSETGTLFLAQCFRTNRGRSCRWWPGLPHIRGTKVPMVLEAPAHPRHQGADAARGARTSSHQGADSGELPQMSETGTVFFLGRFIPLSDLT